MSKLSRAEREGSMGILSHLSSDDLISLCDTVTNRMIKVENAKEALEAILSYSEHAEELLKRKKVHRDAIFKYLSKEGVVMPPTAGKHQLVKRTLEFWCSEKQWSQPASNTKGNVFSGVEAVCDLRALGTQFCQWFFQVLNSQNPALGQPPQAWGPQHFWEDVQLKLLSCTGHWNTEEFQGSGLVSMRLLALVAQERLLFNPNLDARGLKCVSSPHGLVVVAVAGTVHRERACLGIFEQVFCLIRSPLDADSWKIKTVHLKIRKTDSLTREDELELPALQYDSSELLRLCNSSNEGKNENA